jgi:uroporphyrinogen-III synthase
VKLSPSASEQGRRQPLAGKTILVGRARHQAEALASQLRKLGARVLEIPFIQIRSPRSFEPLDTALQQLESYDWLILTSVNGVDALFSRMRKLRIATASLAQLKVAAIGPATERALRQGGLQVAVVPRKYVAEAVVSSLRRRVRGKRVLLVRARAARDIIPRELRSAGAQVDVVEAYETILPRASRRQLLNVLSGSDRPDVITFTSSSSVRNFFALLRGDIDRVSLNGIVLASIGPVTSATMREHALPVTVEAQEFTIPGLVRAIATYVSSLEDSASDQGLAVL